MKLFCEHLPGNMGWWLVWKLTLRLLPFAYFCNTSVLTFHLQQQGEELCALLCFWLKLWFLGHTEEAGGLVWSLVRVVVFVVVMEDPLPSTPLPASGLHPSYCTAVNPFQLPWGMEVIT